MFAYYLRLGFINLRRNPLLTLLMIVILAVGVAASMASLTVLHVMSGDPIPHKSDNLLVPLIDVGPANRDAAGDPPSQLTYTDADALLRAKRGDRQTAVLGIAPSIESGRADLPPFQAEGMAVNADFFAMFDVPFVAGGAWSEDDDTRGGSVAVIAQSLAERLFADADPIGRTMRIADNDYTVVGVTGRWEPLPKFYRIVGSNSFGGFEEVFIPFRTGIAREIDINGSISCDTNGDIEPGFAGLLKSPCTWIQVWVEVDGLMARNAYFDFLQGYVDEQRKLGRIERNDENTVRLFDVMEWLEDQEVVADDSRLQVWLAFGFLLVCLVNTVGLLLAKFTARSGEIGVRRALGAARREVFKQYMIEAGVIGLVGGVLGLLLTFACLWLIGQQSQELRSVARMDWLMFGTTFVLATGASLLAGVLPTWRACQVVPAVQLKTQ